MSLPQPVQDSINGISNGMQTVERGFDLFGTLFQVILWGIPLLLGGGWLLSQFRDQEWAQGIIETVAPFAQTLVGWMPFLRPILGDLADAAPAGSTVAMAANLGVISAEMRDAIIRPSQSVADGATLDRALTAARANSGSAALNGLTRGNLAAAFVNEHVIAALLRDTTPDAVDPARKAGQAMILRVLAVPQPAPTPGQTPAANPALQAIRAFLSNSTLFTQAMATEGAWGTLYDAAQLAGHVTINADARTALNDIPSETRRQLFASFVTDNGTSNTAQVTQAFGSIVNDESITDETLFNVLSGISSTDATINTNIQRMITPAGSQTPSLEYFSTLRENIQAVGQGLIDELTARDAQPITILEREVRRTGSPLNPDTEVAEGQPDASARFASLISLAPPSLGEFRVTPQNAGEVINLMREVEPGTMQAFVNATATIATPLPTQPAQDAPEAEQQAFAAAQTARAEAIRVATQFVTQPVVRTFVAQHPEVLPANIRGLIQAIPSSPEASAATANIAMMGDAALNAEQRQQFIDGISAAVSGEHDYLQLTNLLFDDGLRTSLLENETFQQNLVVIAAEQRSGNVSYEERTVRALLTGDNNQDNSAPEGQFAALNEQRIGTHNLERLANLIKVIDEATGGAQGSAEETAADTRNARVANAILRLASGQRFTEAELRERSPGEHGTTLMQDLRVVMNNETAVNAMKAFLGELNTDNMTPAQQRLIATLEADFWHDNIDVGEMDAMTGRTTYDDDKGLAPALAGRDEVILVLFGVSNNFPYFFDDFKLSDIQHAADAAKAEGTAYNLAHGITGGDTVAGGQSPTMILLTPVLLPGQRSETVIA